MEQHILDAIKQGKIKVLSDQEALNSGTFDVLDGIAEQINQNKIKLLDLHFENIGDNENECFIFTRFEFLE